MPSRIICATALDLATTSGSGNSGTGGTAGSPSRRSAGRPRGSSLGLDRSGRGGRGGRRERALVLVDALEHRRGELGAVGPPARPSGNQPASLPISSGIPETSPMITSACSPRTGSSRLPLRNSTRSAGRAGRRSLATWMASSDRSVPITRLAPNRAATNESTPLHSRRRSRCRARSPAPRRWSGSCGWCTRRRDRKASGPPPFEHGLCLLVGWPIAHPMVPGAAGASQPSRRDQTRGGTNTASSRSNVTRLDGVRERIGRVRDPVVSTPRWPEGYARIRPDARRSNRFAPCAFPRGGARSRPPAGTDP